MTAKSRGLGRGLDAIFTEAATPERQKAALGNALKGAFILRLSDIEPDRAQPRKNFESESLSSLADSISKYGVLQPIVVRKASPPEEKTDISRVLAGKYRIVSGERRWRAAKMAGLTEVPVIIKDLSEIEAAAVTLVENLQREDLNPLEQARGLSRLIGEFRLTQEEAAEAVGISRPSLTNALRLLTLPGGALDALARGEITAGHARALLAIGDPQGIEDAAKTVIEKGLSVRETERLARLLRAKQNEKTQPQPDSREVSFAAYIEKLEDKVSSTLGRRARILRGKKPGQKKGKLELEYVGYEDLERLLSMLCGKEIFHD